MITDRVDLVLTWVVVAASAISIGGSALFGLPPTWWTVSSAALLAHVARRLVEFYAWRRRMRRLAKAILAALEREKEQQP